MGRYTGILGLLTMLALAYAFSTNRRAIRVKTVAWGLSLQIAFAIFVLRIDFGRRAFQVMGDAANKVLSYSFIGSEFLFGPLGKQSSNIGFIFAFQVLPVVIFICALFAILYHVGIMQIVIRAMAWAMTRIMRASGAESLHVLSAVIMTAPGTILISKMLVPEPEQPKTAGTVVMPQSEEEKEKQENLVGAVARGTGDGLHMALNIGAMLIAFLALIALLDGILGGIHNHIAWFPASLEGILGVVFAPVAWVIGIPWRDCHAIGNLLGTRMVLNELVAFSLLGPKKAVLDPRSFTIAPFSLCGFANLSSIGIQIGGIGARAPNKKSELARLGIRAMLAGTMANLMSASIAGMLL